MVGPLLICKLLLYPPLTPACMEAKHCVFGCARVYGKKRPAPRRAPDYSKQVEASMTEIGATRLEREYRFDSLFSLALRTCWVWSHLTTAKILLCFG